MKKRLLSFIFSIAFLGVVAQTDSSFIDRPLLAINLPFTSLINPLFPNLTLGATYYFNEKVSADLDISMGLGSWRLIDSLNTFPTNDFRVLYHIKFLQPNDLTYLSITSGYIRHQGKREHYLPVNYQGIQEAFFYKTHLDFTRNIVPLLLNIGIVDELRNEDFLGFDLSVGAGVYFVTTQANLYNPYNYEFSYLPYEGGFQDPNRRFWPWVNCRMALKFNVIKR